MYPAKYAYSSHLLWYFGKVQVDFIHICQGNFTGRCGYCERRNRNKCIIYINKNKIHIRNKQNTRNEFAEEKHILYVGDCVVRKVRKSAEPTLFPLVMDFIFSRQRLLGVS